MVNAVCANTVHSWSRTMFVNAFGRLTIRTMSALRGGLYGMVLEWGGMIPLTGHNVPCEMAPL